MNIEYFHFPKCYLNIHIIYYKLDSVEYLIEEKHKINRKNIKKYLSEYDKEIILRKRNAIFISNNPKSLDIVLALVNKLEKFIKCLGKRY